MNKLIFLNTMSETNLLLSDLNGSLGESGLDLHINSQYKSSLLSDKFYKRYLDTLQIAKEKNESIKLDKYVLEGLTAWANDLNGTAYSDVLENSRAVVENEMRFFEFSKPLITFLKQNDFNIVIVTNHPQFIAQATMEYLGADDYRSTVFELDENGFFTGKVSSTLIDKKPAIDDLIDKYPIDDDISIGIGDHWADKPIFDVVAYPLWINPKDEMREYISNDSRIKIVTPDTISDEIINILNVHETLTK